MPSRQIAKARQSQLVTTYGVGSLFPAGEQSYMIGGLDDWPDGAPTVHEPRLARALGVRSFKTPASGLPRGDVPAVRFPMTHYCPRCHRLGTLWDLADTVNENDCKSCDVQLVPSRFIACCDAGHIEDFPYRAWVHGGRTQEGEHRLTLKAQGRSSSLGDILVTCTCGARRSMAGSFGKEALASLAPCRGSRPWLPSDDEHGCARPLRTLQRGSSNVWFGSLRSSISIPPWSTAAAAFVDRYWQMLEAMPRDALEPTVTGMLANHPGLSSESVLAVIDRRRGVIAGAPPTDAELRADEYTALSVGTSGTGASEAFICEEEDVASRVRDLVAQVSRVSRLREVRALEGFSRVVPPSPDEDRPLSPLAERPLGWLPAIEVHGEGVFVRFDEDAVAKWESTALAQERATILTRSLHLRDAAASRPPSAPVSARFVLLHSLAHVLITELSLHAGYPTASIRERLYARAGQAGILMYTASSDAAGSLGGLAALAREDRFLEVFEGALERTAWCSSDPVCAESQGSGADNLNLAACHACLLLPETSCEHANVYLDRLSLVDADAPGTGFMTDTLTG